MCHLWGRGEVHPRFWWGDFREKDLLEGVNLDDERVLNWIYGK